VHTAAEVVEEDPNSLRRRGANFDSRYVLCERPTVITGGELSLSMLDLVYNPTSRTYQAPLQLKSTGGVFIVDDLGRQEEPPQALINRWIVPLEEGKDIPTRRPCAGSSTRSRSTARTRRISSRSSPWWRARRRCRSTRPRLCIC